MITEDHYYLLMEGLRARRDSALRASQSHTQNPRVQELARQSYEQNCARMELLRLQWKRLQA